MEVDTPNHQIFTTPCDSSHDEYCRIVGTEVLNKKLSEMTKVWKKDIQKMHELLVWKYDFPFMRPTFYQQNNGLTSYQCFWDWDTKGVSLPSHLEDPNVLEDLVQSKRNREFTIDQWVDTYEKRDIYPILPEEYCCHPGMDLKLFQKLFHRDPNTELLERLEINENRFK